jgi:hypothetical protein
MSNKIIYHAVWTILMFICCIMNLNSMIKVFWLGFPTLLLTLTYFTYHAINLYKESHK